MKDGSQEAEGGPHTIDLSVTFHFSFCVYSFPPPETQSEKVVRRYKEHTREQRRRFNMERATCDHYTKQKVPQNLRVFNDAILLACADRY